MGRPTVLDDFAERFDGLGVGPRAGAPFQLLDSNLVEASPAVGARGGDRVQGVTRARRRSAGLLEALIRVRNDGSSCWGLGSRCTRRPIIGHELWPRGARLGFRWKNDQREYQPERDSARFDRPAPAPAPRRPVYSTFSGLPRNASRASHTAACANGPSRTTRASNRSDSAGGTEVLTSQRQCRGLRGRPMSAALRPAAAREASLPRLLGRPAGRHRRRRPRSVLSQTPPRGRRPSLRSPRGVQD
jgi:hypothetical protein